MSVEMQVIDIDWMCRKFISLPQAWLGFLDMLIHYILGASAVKVNLLLLYFCKVLVFPEFSWLVGHLQPKSVYLSIYLIDSLAVGWLIKCYFIKLNEELISPIMLVPCHICFWSCSLWELCTKWFCCSMKVSCTF